MGCLGKRWHPIGLGLGAGAPVPETVLGKETLGGEAYCVSTRHGLP